jgi:hypothetical protein
METVRLTKPQRITLRAILLLQITHTVFLMTADTLNRLIYPYPLLHFEGGKLVEFMPPWQDRIHWDELSIWCVVLVVEIILWRTLSKVKRYAWPLLATQLIASLFYLSWVVRTGWDSPPVRVSQIGLLVAWPFAAATLWRSRRAFSTCLRQLVQIALAVVLAAIVVFVNGRHFPVGSIEWAFDVPRYVDVIASSRFGWPQESSLVLCWFCYALVAGLAWGLRKIRSREID